jgi:hypothetical protein
VPTNPRDPIIDQLEFALGNAYSFERELGGGGMSRVFLAEERTLGRRVVLKILRGTPTCPPSTSHGHTPGSAKRIRSLHVWSRPPTNIQPSLCSRWSIRSLIVSGLTHASRHF